MEGREPHVAHIENVLKFFAHEHVAKIVSRLLDHRLRSRLPTGLRKSRRGYRQGSNYEHNSKAEPDISGFHNSKEES